MNREDVIRMAHEAGLYLATDVHWMPIIGLDYAEKFAAAAYAAGAAAERVEWEKRVARLQSLMDLRESQPNKPCCLAEREAIVQMIENMPPLLECATNDQGGCLVCGFTPKLAIAAVRARGNKT